jgi:hypothetical protein
LIGLLVRGKRNMSLAVRCAIEQSLSFDAYNDLLALLGMCWIAGADPETSRWRVGERDTICAGSIPHGL